MGQTRCEVPFGLVLKAERLAFAADSCSVLAAIYAVVRDFHHHFYGFDGSDQLAYVARPNCGISLLVRFIFKIFVTA